MSQTLQLSLGRIAQHNKENDLWIIIANNVYDVTKFAPAHPYVIFCSLSAGTFRKYIGSLTYNKIKCLFFHMYMYRGGIEVLMTVAGGDGTEGFNDIGHSDDARKLLKGFLVGSVEGRQVNNVFFLSLFLAFFFIFFYFLLYTDQVVPDLFISQTREDQSSTSALKSATSEAHAPDQHQKARTATGHRLVLLLISLALFVVVFLFILTLIPVQMLERELGRLQLVRAEVVDDETHY